MEVSAFAGGGAFPTRGEEAGIELLPPLDDRGGSVSLGELAFGGEVPDGLAEGLQEVGVAVADVDEQGQGLREVLAAEAFRGFSQGLGCVVAVEWADRGVREEPFGVRAGATEGARKVG